MQSRPHLTLAAIPGSGTRYLPVPAGAIERAHAGAASLTRQLAKEALPGAESLSLVQVSYEGPPYYEGCRHGPHGILSTTINHAPRARPGLNIRRTIEWRWGILRWWSDEWYDTGWHPDAQALAMGSMWIKRLRQALDGQA